MTNIEESEDKGRGTALMLMKKGFRRVTAGVMATAMTFSVLGGVNAEVEKKEELNLYSDSAAIYNLNTGKLVFEKNGDDVHSVAGLSQVMTLALASEDKTAGVVKDDDSITISKNAWAAKLKGNVMFLEVGRVFPFSEIMKGIAVISGNDAALAMGEHLEGTEEKFIKRMNEKAIQLGMDNTVFASAHGLGSGDSKDLSTAKDVALLAKHYVTTYPENLEIHKMASYTTQTGREEITQANANVGISQYEGAMAIKTAYADKKYHMVVYAERLGVKYGLVLLGAGSEKERSSDAKKLLDYGFSQYKKVKFNDAGDFVSNISVYYSPTKKTKVFVSEALEVTLHDDEIKSLKEEVVLPSFLKAPVEKGEVVGKKNIYIDDELVHSIDLVIQEEITDVAGYKKIFHFIAATFKKVQDKVFGD